MIDIRQAGSQLGFFNSEVSVNECIRAKKFHMIHTKMHGSAFLLVRFKVLRSNPQGNLFAFTIGQTRTICRDIYTARDFNRLAL